MEDEFYWFDKTKPIPENVRHLITPIESEVYVFNEALSKLEHLSLWSNMEKALDITIKVPTKILTLEYIANIKSLKVKSLQNLTVMGTENLKFIEGLSLETLTIQRCEGIDAIKFPSSLKRLTIDNCITNKLPKLPSGLNFLGITDCKLTSLPKLPSGLQSLDVDKNSLNSLSNLPPKLKELKCSNNNISFLPEDLPSSLVTLDCSNNPLTLVLNIDKLQNLNCSGCNINYLELPDSLITLNCSKNNIDYLDLPPKLQSLDCQGNPIQYFDSLPKTLTSLNLLKCKIKELPELPNKITSLKISEYNPDISHLDKLEELTMNKCALSELPVLPDTLINLDVKNNQIKSLGNLPPKLSNLNCSNNQIKTIDILPETLLELNCSFNKIEEIKSFPENCGVINCNNNQLKILPKLPEKVLILDCSYNLLTEVPMGNIGTLVFEGNPGFKDYLPKVYKLDMKSEVIKYKGEKINVITIPKGTVLFRGYKDTSRITSDFIGYSSNGDDIHSLHPTHNVFFYPYPYVIENYFEHFEVLAIFVLQKDIKIINQLLPSRNTRDDMNFEKEYITTCDKNQPKGKSYDPCLSLDFIKKHPEIVGEIAIADMDVYAMNMVKYDKVNDMKYRRNFRDFTGHVGVPEFILYPLTKRKEELNFSFKETESMEWAVKHKKDYNYIPIIILNLKEREKYKQTIDAFLSPEGYKDMHMTIDPLTHFYIIKELSDKKTVERSVSISEPNKLMYL